MAREAEVIRLRTHFHSRWREQFPGTPPPPVRTLDILSRAVKDNSSGTGRDALFDAWLASGAVEQLRHNLHCIENTIVQLQYQLSNRICFREFLTQVIDYLCNPASASKNRANTPDVDKPSTGGERCAASAPSFNGVVESSDKDCRDSTTTPQPSGATQAEYLLDENTRTCNFKHVTSVTSQGEAIKPGSNLSTLVTGQQSSATYNNIASSPAKQDYNNLQTNCYCKLKTGTYVPIFRASRSTQTDVTCVTCDTACTDTKLTTSTGVSTIDMFGRRKKPLNAKKSDVNSTGECRDNSAIFNTFPTANHFSLSGSKSDSCLAFATSVRNFQYLKLTDGFNIVLEGQSETGSINTHREGQRESGSINIHREGQSETGSINKHREAQGHISGSLENKNEHNNGTSAFTSVSEREDMTVATGNQEMTVCRQESAASLGPFNDVHSEPASAITSIALEATSETHNGDSLTSACMHALFTPHQAAISHTPSEGDSLRAFIPRPKTSPSSPKPKPKPRKKSLPKTSPKQQKSPASVFYTDSDYLETTTTVNDVIGHATNLFTFGSVTPALSATGAKVFDATDTSDSDSSLSKENIFSGGGHSDGPRSTCAAGRSVILPTVGMHECGEQLTALSYDRESPHLTQADTPVLRHSLNTTKGSFDLPCDHSSQHAIKRVYKQEGKQTPINAQHRRTESCPAQLMIRTHHKPHSTDISSVSETDVKELCKKTTSGTLTALVKELAEFSTRLSVCVREDDQSMPRFGHSHDLMPPTPVTEGLALSPGSYRKFSSENRKSVNPPNKPLPDYSEPDPDYLDSDTDVVEAETDIRKEHLTPSSKHPTRKKPHINTYENWTIDRAVTQTIDWASGDDDDSDDITSLGSTLDGMLTKGSKDSGLSVDMPSKEDGFMDGRVANLHAIEQLNKELGEEDYLEQFSPDNNQDDSASITSTEFVFYPGNENLDSPSNTIPFKTKRNHGSGILDDMSPIFSSGEDDEHDFVPSMDSSYDDIDSNPHLPTSQQDHKLKMRELLISGVLETERTYLSILELLLNYKKTLEASCMTTQPVLSEDDIIIIFGNLQQLYEIHHKFVNGLQVKKDNWSQEQTVGEVFEEMIKMFPIFGKYAENYKVAVATLHKCTQDSPRFQEIAQKIVLTSSTKEVTSLEEALFKPVQRLQRNTLVLHDLIKHTPEGHPDQEKLKNVLELCQYNLEHFGTSVASGKEEEKQRLVKSSFLVELVNGARKLRFIFLFSDLLVCTKREQHRSGKVTFDCKWYIPINQLKLDTKISYEDNTKFCKKDDIDELKIKIRTLKGELKSEMKKESKDKHWSITSMASSRHIERSKKKLRELEAQLILALPRLPFKVSHDPNDSGKTHTLLMTTDYEREEWRETITSICRKSCLVPDQQPTWSAYDVQELVNSVKELPQVNSIGSVVLDQKDEEGIYGTLNVTIHKLNGLNAKVDTYCCLEMDSFDHFVMKARTHICPDSDDPSWNEDFELELEKSQTLRILCYKKGPEKQGDILLGRGALELSKLWLRSTFQERTVAMNEYSLVISVRYTAADKTMQRIPSKQNTAMFGVKIAVSARREGKTIPTIVKACVTEVEKRGMSETGIYRVSGVTSEVQRLKKLFDKNVKSGSISVTDTDIHNVTGVLKLYFRELPEPLFTEASYANFTDALKLSDDEAKERCMLSLLHNLPDANYYTIVYLFEHLFKVSRQVNENKMTIHNLSTIFGPTLLAPAAKESMANPLEMMSKGAEQVMKQSAIVHYFLNMMAKGCDLRKSLKS